MALTTPPVTDEGRWDFRSRITYPNGTAKTGLRVFPPSLETRLIRLQTTAVETEAYRKPPEHWYLAGNLSVVHGTFRDSRTFKVPLNADSFYVLEPISYPFQVGFDAVDWLPNLEVKLYEWGDALAEPMDTLQQGVALLGQNQIQQNEAISAIAQYLAALGESDGGAAPDPLLVGTQSQLGDASAGLAQFFGTGVLGG